VAGAGGDLPACLGSWVVVCLPAFLPACLPGVVGGGVPAYLPGACGASYCYAMKPLAGGADVRAGCSWVGRAGRSLHKL
jgi:hypothetical protein